MKKILFLAIIIAACSSSAISKEHFGNSGRLGFFYSSLSPYGEWIECDYGYVWRPQYVGHGWRPYVNGRWVWTSYGWYWASDESFGWATFHYGRWQYDNYYGWIWIPDDVWGPAWVEWRYDDDYIGWAPLPPQATFSFTVGISYSNGWVSPIHYWNFVPCRNFTTTRIANYIQPIERTRRFFGNTRGEVNIYSDGNRIVNRGIDVRLVERRTNSRINRTDVVERDRGTGDRVVREANRERLEIYRPNLENRGRQEIDRPRDARMAERPIRIEGLKGDRSINQEERSQPTRQQDMRIHERESKDQMREQQRSVSRERATREQNRIENRDAQRVEQRREDQHSHERPALDNRGRGRTEQQVLHPDSKTRNAHAKDVERNNAAEKEGADRKFRRI